MAPCAASISMSLLNQGAGRFIYMDPLKQTSADLRSANEIPARIHVFVLEHCSPFLLAIISARQPRNTCHSFLIP